MSEKTINREDLISVRRGAEMLGVASNTIRRRIADGMLPAWKDALHEQAVFVRRADIEAMRDHGLTPLAVESAA